MCACLCSLSISVIKHHGPGSLKVQEFMWVIAPEGQGSVMAGRHSDKVPTWWQDQEAEFIP